MSTNNFLTDSVSSIRNFFEKESSGGILLILATIVALVWANSPFASTYFNIWDTPVSIAIGSSEFSKPLLLWVNDGLMAIFFFTIGLEIKREVLEGELSSPRKAILPLFAALGGMVVPVGLFFLLHNGQAGIEAWGIPMATDIAFSIGILSLLGSRVPLGMKVFLTAFAIIDDIGAVLIIALFYGHEVHLQPLMLSGLFLLLLLACNYIFSIKRNWIYVIGGVAVWYCMFQSGIHPTIAGVLVAFTVPASNKIRFAKFAENLKGKIDLLSPNEEKETDANDKIFLKSERIKSVRAIKRDIKAVQPPLQRLEYNLESFIAFFVMPLFALANAGVALKGEGAIFTAPMFIHVGVALLFGKMIGIFSFSWLSVKLGLTDLPSGTRWLQMLGLALLGGIGFTMALFISNLALEAGTLLSQAKLGILAGSLVAGLSGYGILWYTLYYRREKDSSSESTSSSSSQLAEEMEV
jgi:NhaA family Na+:H+ antiporter